jgi:hypothetical protein
MSPRRGARTAGRSFRAVRTKLYAATLGASALLMLLGAGPAAAGLPREFSVFDDCPVSTPGVVGCVVSYTTGGEFHLGSKTVPINKTITLQGGLTESSPNLVPAADGNTLSRTSLQLPGGLIGIELLPPLTEVTATAELAGPVGMNLNNFFARSGAAVSLPLKIKLDNPSLGSSCFIGANASPVAPQLTTGTTNPPSPGKPITGSAGTIEYGGAGTIVIVGGATLVDNAFAVPGASGCGGLLSLVVDPSVDLIAGLPAGAGHNTAILASTFESVSARLVVAQRELPELGRCVKLEGVKEGKTKTYDGSYANSGCTTFQRQGQYEWTTGPGARPGFTASGGAASLETVGGASRLTCSQTAGSGAYTGAKTATATLTLTGCKLAASKAPCRSAGAAAGEIVTSPLAGKLGFIKDAVEGGQLRVSVGLDLEHSPTLLAAECDGGVDVSVSGSVIAPFKTLEKTAATSTLAFGQTAGRQLPEAFEEGAPDTLSTVFGTQPAQQSGLKVNLKLHNEEPIEVKGEAH